MHTAQKIGLVWFKNDLRIHDNETLSRAVSECNAVIPIFIIDPRWSASTVFGFRKTGQYRMQFIKECVSALQQKLQALGSDLFILEGLPEEIIPKLIIKHAITDVYSKQEFGCDEAKLCQKVNRLVAAFKANYHQCSTSVLLHKHLLPFDQHNLPENFQDFIAYFGKNFPVRELAETPTKINTIAIPNALSILAFEKFLSVNSKDARSEFNFVGGEDAALARVNEVVWQNDTFANAVANESTKDHIVRFSSKLSPWIAQGSLSVVHVFQQLLAFQVLHPQSAACNQLINDLLLREFYYYHFQKFGAKFFRQGGVHNKMLTCTKDYDGLYDWINGQTQDDYINACMLELKTTGWLNKKGRHHVVNYLSKHLLVDWRIGGAYFESQLLDYDVVINYANWSKFVGVGIDATEDMPRLNFEQVKNKYDKDQTYRKKWLTKNVNQLHS
jgi:deoxyribodipyrimidine photo-lyase